MKDPAYNTMLGSAHISDRMDEFTGLVLTLAGYNAGPGRARVDQGVRRSARWQGRSIDWIHRIPFEGREYVQKVLSNIRSTAPASAGRPPLRLNADQAPVRFAGLSNQ
jgi:soluble lytic murein transglycosylase-like protein